MLSSQAPMKIDYSPVEDVLNYVYDNAKENDPNSIIETIDKFCYEKSWCMNVGDVKGKIVQDVIVKQKPKILVEIGGYYGYSAIMFANLIKDDSEAHYYSIEYNSIMACVIEKLVKFAGLEHKITVLTGNLEKCIPVLREKYNIGKVDFLFIDHKKEYYLSDFKLAEKSLLFRSGTVVVADNVVYPGAPDYIKYLNSHSSFQSQLVTSELEYTKGETEDALLISTCN